MKILKKTGRLLSIEIDEMWSFVKKKREKDEKTNKIRRKSVWLWYVFNREIDQILAWVCGPRKSKTLYKLSKLQKYLPIDSINADDFSAYQKVFSRVSKLSYNIGKLGTQCVELNNENWLKKIHSKSHLFF